MGDAALIQFLTSAAAPLWAVFLVVAVTAIRMTPQWMERWLAFIQARAERRTQDWTRLQSEVTRLSNRVEALERKLVESETDRASWMSRAIKAEAALQGMGEVRQAAASAAAEVRLAEIDKAKKKP